MMKEKQQIFCGIWSDNFVPDHIQPELDTGKVCWFSNEMEVIK